MPEYDFLGVISQNYNSYSILVNGINSRKLEMFIK